MFLLLSLQQRKDDIGIIVLNVKGADLLRLDEDDPSLKESEKQYYTKCDLECQPFTNVRYFYPYHRNEEKCFSNTYLSAPVLEAQHGRDIAHNYISTYEENNEQLDLLFSNIDDPTQTMDSILSFIAENKDFQGLAGILSRSRLPNIPKKGTAKTKISRFNHGENFPG